MAPGIAGAVLLVRIPFPLPEDGKSRQWLWPEDRAAWFRSYGDRVVELAELAREAGVMVQGRLYADALSEHSGPAASYEAMFRHNIGLLVPAMLG